MKEETMEEIILSEKENSLLHSWRRNHLLSVIMSGVALLSMYIYFQSFFNDVLVLLILLAEVTLAGLLHYLATDSREKLIALILEKFDIDKEHPLLETTENNNTENHKE